MFRYFMYEAEFQFAQCFVKRGHSKYSCFENAGFQYIQCFWKGGHFIKLKYLQNIYVLKKKGHFDKAKLQYAQCFEKERVIWIPLERFTKYSCFENTGFQYIQCFEKGVTSFEPKYL